MNNNLKFICSSVVGVAMCAGLLPMTAAAADIDMAIQPVRSEKETREIYKPLADYLAKVTGQNVVIHTSRDFSEYWVTQKVNNPFEIIIDNAFFSDFRIEREGWVSLAKLPGLISYSLLATAENPFFEPSDLVGKKISSLIPPAPSGIFLGQMFRNPLRQPAIVPTTTAKDALQLLLDGKVDATIISAPMANEAMASGADLLVVKTSVQIPDSALSVSSSIDEATREKIATALLEADQNKLGQAALKSLDISNFEPADPSLYSGLMQYLIDAGFES